MQLCQSVPRKPKKHQRRAFAFRACRDLPATQERCLALWSNAYFWHKVKRTRCDIRRPVQITRSVANVTCVCIISVYPVGMRHVLLGALIALPVGALAQEFNLRDGDQPLSVAALSDRLSGQTVTFFDGGQSEFYTDGRYTYTYSDDGGTAYGYWTFAENGKVCIDYVNGFARCDMYVQSGQRLILLDEKGNRYPTRAQNE